MRIIVEVSGGCVQAVYADGKRPVKVDLLDWDNINDGGGFGLTRTPDEVDEERRLKRLEKRVKSRAYRTVF